MYVNKYRMEVTNMDRANMDNGIWNFANTCKTLEEIYKYFPGLMGDALLLDGWPRDPASLGVGLEFVSMDHIGDEGPESMQLYVRDAPIQWATLPALAQVARYQICERLGTESAEDLVPFMLARDYTDEDNEETLLIHACGAREWLNCMHLAAGSQLLQILHGDNLRIMHRNVKQSFYIGVVYGKCLHKAMVVEVKGLDNFCSEVKEHVKNGDTPMILLWAGDNLHRATIYWFYDRMYNQVPNTMQSKRTDD